MAQWSHADRTLYAKLVYYGPAYGGKTTNLESLHRLTDPEGEQSLLSLKTSQDRTLFFDLLPFDLGRVFDYQVAVKLYTVPGQVRYDATRRVVLTGADAVVFVADSSPERAAENRASLENLRHNLVANGIDPDHIPVLHQANKQDVEGALPPERVAEGMGVDPTAILGSVATEGKGVLETFVNATKAMLRKLAAAAPATGRKRLRSENLEAQVDRALAPHLARIRAGDGLPALPATEQGQGRGRVDAVVGDGDDVAESSLRASLQLGERLADSRHRAAWLEAESRALRHLCDALRRTGASFELETIVKTTMEVAAETVGAAVLTLADRRSGGGAFADRVWGRDDDPLRCEPAAADLLGRLLTSTGPCVVEDLSKELGDPLVEGPLAGIRSVACVPLGGTEPHALLAYAPAPDGRFDESRLRFLATVAAHLAVGREKARLYRETEAHRRELEVRVRERTEELSRANRELRRLGEVKDRFLASVSHEMRTPLTGIANAATLLKDYSSEPDTVREMAAGIVDGCAKLESHLGSLLRVARLEGRKLQIQEASITDVITLAIHLAGDPEVRVELDPRIDSVAVDVDAISRALANLIDNARKFSPEGAEVDVRVFRRGEEAVFAVLDHGPGIPLDERGRVFEPFEQVGDPMTGKPDGVGLGLHESRVLVRRHGGRVEYRERSGGGSEFRVTVPVERPTGKAREAVGA